MERAVSEKSKLSHEDAELLQSLRDEFFENAFIEIEDWETDLLDFEQSGAPDKMKNLRRLIHSMKGSSQAIGLVETGAILHELEAWLLNAETGLSRTQVVSTGLAFVDQLKVYLHLLANGGDAAPAASELRNLLKS